MRVRLASESSWASYDGTRKWGNAFRVVRESYFKPRILNPLYQSVVQTESGPLYCMGSQSLLLLYVFLENFFKMLQDEEKNKKKGDMEYKKQWLSFKGILNGRNGNEATDLSKKQMVQ